jgi:hypothetical protein
MSAAKVRIESWKKEDARVLKIHLLFALEGAL